MSSEGTRERALPFSGITAVSAPTKEFFGEPCNITQGVLLSGKQITVSESHPRDRSDGSYRAGGPFFTSRITPFSTEGKIGEIWDSGHWSSRYTYEGPVPCPFPTRDEMNSIGFNNPDLQFGDKNESQMKESGTKAISLASPVNPNAQLGTTLAETFREGVPSLPGVKSWRSKADFLRKLGDEYLNYQFGWAPLESEVKDVAKAASKHRDIMDQYRRGEGADTHRTFSFPISVREAEQLGTYQPSLIDDRFAKPPYEPRYRVLSMVEESKSWFEGCFTYALPSSANSWQRQLGFGSEADQVLGLALTPTILWELTPWSWAVDWFSNTGEVVNNLTNFGLAGQSMRYGFMMEESIQRVTATQGGATYFRRNAPKDYTQFLDVPGPVSSSGFEIVTKRRLPASPFGFSVGWEGLSPTQLAITAALGITRLR